MSELVAAFVQKRISSHAGIIWCIAVLWIAAILGFTIGLLFDL